MINLKNGKKSYINYLYIIFIIGIIILLFGNSISDEDKANNKKSEVQENHVITDEKRLVDILSQIKGVGSVSVMITYENSGTANYLSDVTYENKDNTEKNTKKVVMTSGEPVMYEEKMPEVMGVIVVCDGAENDYVKRNVIEAVCAVTGVYEHKVGVFEKK